MLNIKSRDLIEEYYKTLKDQYPDLTFDQCKDIVQGPFRELKDSIETGELATVRLKYFGTFLVYPNRAKAYLKVFKDKFLQNKISRDEYFYYKRIIEAYLEKT